jgi:uncharacterized protein involved in exopolysaccharide biosynthesis
MIDMSNGLPIASTDATSMSGPALPVSRDRTASSQNPPPKLHHYLAWSILLSLGLATLVGLYLQTAPKRYASKMMLNLPSVSSVTRIDVPGLGATSVQNNSPYASAQDPRENYKIIADSDNVLAATAKILNRPIKEIGRPKVKIVDGATVMQVEFQGKTPEEAREKTNAFYQAMEQRLNDLRQQSRRDREESFQDTLTNSQQKLTSAQQDVSRYRANSGLSSDEQIKELATNIENLRRQRAELIGDQQKVTLRRDTLRDNLNLDAGEATNSLALQSDPLFQQTIKNYSEVTAQLASLEALYRSNNPQVQQAKAKQAELRSLLSARAQAIVGDGNILDIPVSMPDASAAREVLIQDLVLSQADSVGLEAKVAVFDRQIAQLEDRLQQLAQSQSNLDTLKRNLQIAETVFSSKLTQLDVDNNNAFDAYPKMQILASPSLSDQPIGPKKNLAIGGVGVMALLLNSGAFTLWAHHRKNWKLKQQKIGASSESPSGAT